MSTALPEMAVTDPARFERRMKSLERAREMLGNWAHESDERLSMACRTVVLFSDDEAEILETRLFWKLVLARQRYR